MSQVQLYQNWHIPFVPLGRECGIARDNAAEVITRIYSDGLIFLGYDAFTVFPDGNRQPRTDFCASFSANNQPSLDEAINSLIEDPLQVTHYVFYFKFSA